MIRAADDPEVGVRLKAMADRVRNICNRRLIPAQPLETCWCKILTEPGSAALPCPPEPGA